MRIASLIISTGDGQHGYATTDDQATRRRDHGVLADAPLYEAWAAAAAGFLSLGAAAPVAFLGGMLLMWVVLDVG